MKSELAEEIFELIQARSHAPTPMEFEMAYQARVAIDRIRFAIKHTERFAPDTDQMRDVGLQLLDALQRLEAIDRGSKIDPESRWKAFPMIDIQAEVHWRSTDLAPWINRMASEGGHGVKQCAQIDTEKRLDNHEAAYGAGGRHQREHTNLPYQTDSGSDRVMDGQTDFPRVVGIKQVAITLGRTEKVVCRTWERGDQRAWDPAIEEYHGAHRH